jgi:predicted porin
MAVLACLAPLALAAPAAYADTADELKSEIQAQRALLEAQRAQIEAQRARLEALEKRLEAATAVRSAAAGAAQGPSAPAPVAAAPTEAVPEPARTIVASGDWAPGFTFRATPVDTVTLYGLIDATLSDISNANAAGAHKRSYQTAWFSGDRWGITGRHGINNDTAGVIFKLESEFDYQTGEEDTPGVLFNRDAWIGFQSETLGKLTFGRQNAVARDFTGIYGDPFTNARVTTEEGGYTNVNNFKQLIFYAASATGTRYDRGLVWKKDFGGLVAGIGYQFGGVTGAFQTNSTQTVALGYNGPGDLFHLAGFYNHFNVNGLIHKAYSAGGNFAVLPVLRLYAGYYKYDSEQGGGVGNRKDHAETVSLKFAPGGPMDYMLGYQVLHAANAGVNSAGNVLTPYADASGVRATATGDKTTTYGAMFYHFDPRAEIYVTADFMKLKDGYKLAVTNGHSSQTEFGTGVRLKF